MFICPISPRLAPPRLCFFPASSFEAPAHAGPHHTAGQGGRRGSARACRPSPRLACVLPPCCPALPLLPCRRG